jgi:hypothetical protein
VRAEAASDLADHFLARPGSAATIAAVAATGIAAAGVTAAATGLAAAGVATAATGLAATGITTAATGLAAHVATTARVTPSVVIPQQAVFEADRANRIGPWGRLRLRHVTRRTTVFTSKLAGINTASGCQRDDGNRYQELFHQNSP